MIVEPGVWGWGGRFDGHSFSIMLSCLIENLQLMYSTGLHHLGQNAPHPSIWCVTVQNKSMGNIRKTFDIARLPQEQPCLLFGFGSQAGCNRCQFGDAPPHGANGSPDTVVPITHFFGFSVRPQGSQDSPQMLYTAVITVNDCHLNTQLHIHHVAPNKLNGRVTNWCKPSEAKKGVFF